MSSRAARKGTPPRSRCLAPSEIGRSSGAVSMTVCPRCAALLRPTVPRPVALQEFDAHACALPGRRHRHACQTFASPA